jgi:YHS domain-containing protein
VARRRNADVLAVRRARSSRLGSAALAALLSLLTVLSACRAAAPFEGPTAECPVCKHDGDLACLCVHVEADTPSCECDGKTFYFCSEQCRADFQADPERYR